MFHSPILDDMPERLHKYMARCGVASRRRCEELIAEGKVRVNDAVVTTPGSRINPAVDRIEVDSEIVKPTEKVIYIMLNKPPGYITSASDSFKRPTVFELVKEIPERLFPVGRLDLDSRGLLLMTNDGTLTYRLTHPSYEVEKEYQVRLKGEPKKEELEKVRSGVEINGDYITHPAKVSIIEKKNNRTLLKVVIMEGRKRQVKRMFAAIGYKVEDLKRSRVGELRLGNLPEGKWRFLTEREVSKLKQMVDLDLLS